MEHIDNETARNLLRHSLPADVRTSWESHLSNCPACQKLVEDERALAGLLRLGDEAPPAEDSAARMIERLQPHFPDPRDYNRATARLVTLAACAGCLLGAVFQTAIAPSLRSQTPAKTQLSAAERAAAEQIDTLDTLHDNPWIADNLEAARWLERLVAGDGGGQ